MSGYQSIMTPDTAAPFGNSASYTWQSRFSWTPTHCSLCSMVIFSDNILPSPLPAWDNMWMHLYIDQSLSLRELIEILELSHLVAACFRLRPSGFLSFSGMLKTLLLLCFNGLLSIFPIKMCVCIMYVLEICVCLCNFPFYLVGSEPESIGYS